MRGFAMDVHYRLDDGQTMKAASDEFVASYREGRVNSSTLVWSHGMDEWLPLGQSPLQHLVEDVPPPLPDARSGLPRTTRREDPGCSPSRNRINYRRTVPRPSRTGVSQRFETESIRNFRTRWWIRSLRCRPLRIPDWFSSQLKSTPEYRVCATGHRMAWLRL